LPTQYLALTRTHDNRRLRLALRTEHRSHDSTLEGLDLERHRLGEIEEAAIAGVYADLGRLGRFGRHRWHLCLFAVIFGAPRWLGLWSQITDLFGQHLCHRRCSAI